MASDAFAEIRGQDEAVEVLRRAVAGDRVAHAYAFVGPAGTRAQGHSARLRQGPGGAGRCRSGRAHRPGHMSGCPADRADTAREEPQGAPRPAHRGHSRARASGRAPSGRGGLEGLHRGRRGPDDGAGATGNLEDAGGAARPHRDRPHPFAAARAARDRPLPLPDPSVPPRVVEGARALLPDGRSEPYAAALSALAESRAGGAGAILRVGEALGRDRAAAETLVEACWLHYRDLLCREGGGDPRWAVFETPPALVTRGLDELLRGLGACREAWQALQGNVSPRLTVEVLLGRLSPAEVGS